MVDLTPGFVDDAVDKVVDAGGHVVDKAGDGLHFIVQLHAKSVEGLWDLAEDGFDAVMGAVRECMEWLWEQVPEFIRHPFGDPGPLQQAAAAWRAVAEGVEGTRDDLLAGGRTLHEWRGPAADRFDTYLNGLLKDSSTLRNGIEEIAKSLTDAADALSDLNRLVHSVLAEIAAYIVIDVILTLLTGGGGAAAAAAQVAMLVARVTSAIRKASAIVRRVLPALRQARALQALTRVTFKVDDMFDAFKTGKLVTKLDDVVRRGDQWNKWLSTTVGGGVGTSVATGKDPSRWGPTEWATFGIGTVASVKLGDRLKPLWQHTRKGPDGLLAAATNSSLASGFTNLLVQPLTTGSVDTGALGLSMATGGMSAGAARSLTFRVRGQGWTGRSLADRGISPSFGTGERSTHVKLTEGEKGAGRTGDGLLKGTLRQPFTPDPPGPGAPDGQAPHFTDVPKRPFGRPTYTVRPGDDLSTIALALLGDGNRWPELVGGADPAIADPDLIHPGQTITLPR
jgi:hypothetical protein